MEFIHFIIDFILHIDQHLESLIATYGLWVYVILMVILFCETGLVIAPLLPGDSLLFVAGALASWSSTHLNVHLLAVLLSVAAILGDAVNYWIGHKLGDRLFSNASSKIFRRQYLIKTEHFYQRHGGKTIIIARFIPIVRTFAPFVAGMGHMHYRRFALFNVIGAVLWVCFFIYAGYYFSNLTFIQQNIHWLFIVIIAISIVPAGFEAFKYWRKTVKDKN